jgi:hypothetical protein
MILIRCRIEQKKSLNLTFSDFFKNNLINYFSNVPSIKYLHRLPKQRILWDCSNIQPNLL